MSELCFETKKGNIVDGFQNFSGNVDERQKHLQRRAACKEAYSNLIEAAVVGGWRKEEIALEMADTAEDYIMELASQKKSRDRA